MNQALRRAGRTLAQFAVSGGLVALVGSLSGDLSPTQNIILLGICQLVVSFSQNALEDAGKVPVLLGTKPAPPAPLSTAGQVQQATDDWPDDPNEVGVVGTDINYGPGG